MAAIPLQVLQDKEEYWYGFPAYDHKGMKIGKFNHLREAMDPNKQDKQVTAADEEVRCELASCLPVFCDLSPLHAQEWGSSLLIPLAASRCAHATLHAVPKHTHTSV